MVGCVLVWLFSKFGGLQCWVTFCISAASKFVIVTVGGLHRPALLSKFFGLHAWSSTFKWHVTNLTSILSAASKFELMGAADFSFFHASWKWLFHKAWKNIISHQSQTACSNFQPKAFKKWLMVWLTRHCDLCHLTCRANSKWNSDVHPCPWQFLQGFFHGGGAD